MAEIDRLGGCNDWIDLDLVERERTPSEPMKFVFDSIWLDYHFRIPSQNLRSLVSSGHEKPFTIGVQKGDLQPADDASPD